MAKQKKAEAAAPVEQAATPETTTSIEPIQLTISDLQLLARIVDLASRRGAFQAAELSQVGESYNKLSGFLSYVESVQKEEAAASAAEGEAAPSAEAAPAA